MEAIDKIFTIDELPINIENSRKKDYITVEPNSGSNLNRGTINFITDYADFILPSKSYIIIKGEITNENLEKLSHIEADGSILKKKIIPVNNAPMFLFSRAMYILYK